MSEQSDVNNDIRFLEHTISENEAKKSRLDSRLLEAFNQLKEIQNDVAETTKAYKQAKSKLTHAENEIKRLE